jgi:hypothetical protein
MLNTSLSTNVRTLLHFAIGLVPGWLVYWLGGQNLASCVAAVLVGIALMFAFPLGVASMEKALQNEGKADH